MAKKGGGGDVLEALGYVALTVGAVWGLSYLVSGRATNNSPLVPDALENRIDEVVETLNNVFGHRWVTASLDYLQSRMALAMPGAAAFVNAVHWAEQHYGGYAGATKKQAALGALRS
ncbi:hypothetical protein [Longimicrobium sp.]|jgi:hypothetical protein|uniref:hypothetical protein n=1 Tax=Longimicrobium sp. TaxID=2029185 RepID=UPI002ED806A9